MKMSIQPSFIEQNWPLTNVELQEIYRAEPRVVQRISSDQGNYIIKAADPSKDTEAVERDTAIFSFLETRQFPAPRLLHTKHGQSYVQHSSRFWYILECIDGNAKIEETPNNWQAVGELMGRLHSLDDHMKATAFTFSSEIPRMLKRAKQYNIGLGNVIQRKDGSFVLVDWDDAGLGTRILDIGFPLICAFVKDDTFNAENARAFYEGYASRVTITSEEKAHLFDAALFFILSYSILDGSGIHYENWQKAQFAVGHRDEIEAVLGSILAS